MIEQIDAAHKTNLMHSHIRLLTGRKRGSNKYIGELYNDDRGDMPEIVAGVQSPITQREVEHAIRGMLMRIY